MIPEEIVEKVFELAVIQEVVGDYVHLKRAGVNYKGPCPFHDEKTPSFVVSPAKGIYKCFGCGASGNSVKFVMEHEKISFPEAIKILAKKYNIEIREEDITPEQIKEKKNKDSLYVIVEFAKSFFVRNLETSEGKNVAMSYFRQRGFREDIIKKFELGWSPSKRDAFTSEALRKGYKSEYLEKAGLTIVKAESNYRFDRFAERVIFPIHTLSGKVTAFGARTLRSDKKTAKYLNSPESEIYHKSKVLYGLFQAKNSIVKKKKCYLVEGYTDVISMHQAGIENVVASSGTALTEPQIKLIRRFSQNLTVIFDGDSAGMKAALRGIDLILAQEMNVKIVALPEGEDPDSFVKKNSSEEVEDYIFNNETDFIHYKIKHFTKDSETLAPVERAQITQSIVSSIACIPNKILRTEYIRSSAQLLSTKEDILNQAVLDILRKKVEKGFAQTKTSVLPKPSEPRPLFSTKNIAEKEEKKLLDLLLNYGNQVMAYDEDTQQEIRVSDYIISELINEELTFSHSGYKEVFDLYLEYYDSESVEDLGLYFAKKSPKSADIVANLTAPRRELSKLWESEKEDVSEQLHLWVPRAVDQLKLKVVQKRIADLNEQIARLYTEEPIGYENELLLLRQEKKQLEEIKIQLTLFTRQSPLL